MPLAAVGSVVQTDFKSREWDAYLNDGGGVGGDSASVGFWLLEDGCTQLLEEECGACARHDDDMRHATCLMRHES